MIFFGTKTAWIAGALMLCIAGCAGPQADSAPPEPSASEQTEPASKSVPEPEPAPPEPTAQAETDIWATLREADTHYYVLMRHAIAPGTGDPPRFQLDDCSTQRNLSEEGRAQARRTGEAFREQNVAVQQVLSSEWCRCLDTAELLNLGPVEAFPALNSFFEDRAKGPERTERLRAYMAENRDAPQVTVMVTHFVNISAVAGGGVSSGEMVVMSYDQDQLEVVGRIEAF
ncbi:MAG: histidine phosphatase family protein [Elainellaceae cyanobacterium]